MNIQFISPLFQKYASLTVCDDLILTALAQDLEPHTYPNLEELRLNWNPPNLDPYFFTQLSRGGALPRFVD